MSARDAGAAHQIAALARHFGARGDFLPRLAAMGPAVEVFRRYGLEATEVALQPARSRKGAEAEALLAAADSLLDASAADAVLTGLSGPDIGLDEALIARAGTRPSYALQDYWGDVNRGFGRTAGTFFVGDEYAARLTRRRAPCRIVVTGSPRHAGVAAEDLAGKSGGVLFCGQPLWHLPGYAGTLTVLAGVVRELGLPLGYRPHPAEDIAQRRRAQGILSQPGIDAVSGAAIGLSEALSAATVVASCYSSCGLDLAYLNRVSPRPLGGVVCLMFEPDIRHYYREYSGLARLPLAELGLALEVDSADSLAGALARAAGKDWRRHCRAIVGEALPAPEDAAERIAAVIRDDLASQENIRRTR